MPQIRNASSPRLGTSFRLASVSGARTGDEADEEEGNEEEQELLLLMGLRWFSEYGSAFSVSGLLHSVGGFDRF